MFSSHDGRYLYVSRPSFADVVAIDLGPARSSGASKVDGYRADHMAISPDGKRLLVSASTAARSHVIDTATGKIVGQLRVRRPAAREQLLARRQQIFHASIGTVYTPTDAPGAGRDQGRALLPGRRREHLRILKRVDMGQKLGRGRLRRT